MSSVVDLKTCLKVVEATPCDQPILITGGHGIGKSESITKYFEERGYLVIVLFVGQMADAGDLIGLPDRVEIEYKYTDKEGVEHKGKSKITEFCPPKWWPFDTDSKVMMFFDEVNRGKPETMQCLMDMILNKKLNGRELPPMTRIMGSMNPLEDGYYQVEELDPAFLDRWNIYELKPTVEEWLFWGARNGVDNNVLGFITKYLNHLDPPKPSEAKVGEVYPSRRSWVKVSKYLKWNTRKEDGKHLKLDEKIFEKYLQGVVGLQAAADYVQYIRTEVKLNLNVGSMLLQWEKEYEHTIKQLDSSQVLHMNVQIATWLENNEQTMIDSDKSLSAIAWNLENYLNLISPAFMAQFFDYLATAFEEGKDWPQMVMDNNQNISNKFVDVLNGEDLED